MCAAVDELCRQNQTLNNNVINIQQRQQEATPTKEGEMLDPLPLSDEKREALNLKVSSLYPW